MKKHRAQKDILYISISIFVVAVAWIASNIYHSYTTSQISQEIQLQLDPIDPTFDQATIDKLKTRKKVVPVYELKVTVGPSVDATEAAEESIINSIEGE